MKEIYCTTSQVREVCDFFYLKCRCNGDKNAGTLHFGVGGTDGPSLMKTDHLIYGDSQADVEAARLAQVGVYRLRIIAPETLQCSKKFLRLIILEADSAFDQDFVFIYRH